MPCTCSRVLALACQRPVSRQVKARIRARGSRGANWYSEKRANYVRSKTRTQNCWCSDMNSKRCCSHSHVGLALSSPPRSSGLAVSRVTAKWELDLTNFEALAPGGGPSRLLREQAGASIGFVLKRAGKAGWGMCFVFVGFGIGVPSYRFVRWAPLGLAGVAPAPPYAGHAQCEPRSGPAAASTKIQHRPTVSVQFGARSQWCVARRCFSFMVRQKHRTRSR